MSWSVDIDPVLAPLLPLVTGTAVCRAVAAIVGTDVAALKWPNDVLVPSHGERKLVGILAEVANVERSDNARSADKTGRVASALRVIVGMGMNIDLALDDAPEDVAARAVDLQTLTGCAVDRAVLVDALLDACDEAIDDLVRSKEVALEHYRARCLTIGRSIRFETPAGELEGTVVDVGDDGALVLRTADEHAHHLTAGDAHHVA